MIATQTISQTIDIPASPKKVFEALMDSHKHTDFTGTKAEIIAQAGSTFMAYDGYISGKNIELIPDKKIVQSWRGSDWPKHHFSLVTFELSKTNKGTRIVFTQTNVPADKAADIAQGWNTYYWEKLTRYFSKKN